MDKKKILIIDDEVDMVGTLVMWLEAAGYDTVSAYDGQEGMEKVRKEKPDLILLDIMLPKMDGFSLCRLLKFNDKYKDIPIIIITAKTQEQDRVTGMNVGANEYVTKPFDGNTLLMKIKKFLD